MRQRAITERRVEAEVEAEARSSLEIDAERLSGREGRASRRELFLSAATARQAAVDGHLEARLRAVPELEDPRAALTHLLALGDCVGAEAREAVRSHVEMQKLSRVKSSSCEL